MHKSVQLTVVIDSVATVLMSLFKSGSSAFDSDSSFQASRTSSQIMSRPFACGAVE